MTDGQAVDFDPALDTFYAAGLGPRDFDFGAIEAPNPNAGRGLMLQQRDITGAAIKTVFLLFTPVGDQTNMFKVNSAHITFENGLLLLGDDDVGIGDDLTIATLTGGAGNDVLVSLGGSQTLNGNDGDDLFITVEKQSSPQGSSGNDAFNGGNGIDTLALDADVTGGTQITQYTVNLATETGSIASGSGNSTFTLTSIERVEGSDVADHITGSAGNDWLAGEFGNDTLLGGDGNDALEAGQGSDYIDGGAGRDRVDFSQDGGMGGVTVNLAAGTAVMGIETDTLISVEHIIGTHSADTLTADATQLLTYTLADNPVTFEGLSGNDTIDGGGDAPSSFVIASYASSQGAVNVNLFNGTASDGMGGTDTLINIDAVIGSAGNDVLTGGSTSSQIVAGNLFEQFEGGLGSDTIDGGNGADLVSYEHNMGAVTVTLDSDQDGGNGFSGTAVENGGMMGPSTDTLTNIEQIRGSMFADNLTGSTADNAIQGMGGADSIDGGAGFDTLRYDGSIAPVVVTFSDAVAGSGIATDGGFNGTAMATDSFSNMEAVRGSDYNDTLVGGIGDQTFEGMAGNDSMNGGAGVDTASYSSSLAAVTVSLASGMAFDNWGGTDSLTGIENVTGSHFNDTLTGDANNNTLWGQTGNDTIDGGAGQDIARYSGLKSEYTVTKGAGYFTVTDNNPANGNDGVDTLYGIEKLVFSDGFINLGGKTPGNDFNGDSKTDLLWLNTATGNVSVWEMNGAAVQGGVGYSLDLNWTLASSKSDFNGDGKSDLLWQNTATGNVSVWEMNGAAIQNGVGYSLGANWMLESATSDFNGDGKNDLLWHNTATGNVGVWEMNGAAVQNGVGYSLGANWMLDTSI